MGKWKGLGPGIPKFFRPCEMGRPIGEFHLEPKKLRNSRALCTGLYKLKVLRLFHAHEPQGDFNGVYPREV